MTTVSFRSLLRWELRQLVKSKLLWLMLAIVAGTFFFGARSGADLHDSQKGAQAAARTHEQAWLKDVTAKAEKYRRASPTALPYWQDPTDVAGFSQYFLLRHSVKPHLPLSPLAVGVSDLLPDRQRIKLATPFGTDETYDFQNPRGLALGRFDLSFAVTNLLPIGIILLSVLLCTYERDRGILRLIAAQAVSPRRWLTARLAALAMLLLPALAFIFTLALAVVDVPFSEALPELSASLVLLVAYALFWLAACGFVLSAWPRASSALAALCGIWIVLVVAIPLLANTVGALRPPALSAAQEVEVRRTINDEVQQRRDDIVMAGFRAHASLARFTDRVPEIDHSTRLSFLVPELEKRLSFVQEVRADTRRWNDGISRWAQWFAPNLGVASSFATLAGTDLSRHRDFEARSRQFQLELRQFFYPLMYREIVSPTRPQYYGRFSFTAFDSIPRFDMRDAGSGERVRAAAPVVVWLLILASVFLFISIARLRRWPETL